MRFISAATASFMLAGATTALADPLLANGDFETGVASRWTSSGSVSILNDINVAHTGSWFAAFASDANGALSQVVGGGFQSYDLNFWAQGATFNVLWDGTVRQGTSVADDTSLTFDVSGGNDAWENFNFVLPGSAAASHQLTFQHVSLPSAFTYTPRLDSIALTGSQPVPEPPGFALLGIGLVGFAAALYRKKSRPNGLVPTGSTNPGHISNTLLREESLLRRAGISGLQLTGSASRGRAGTNSDVDLIATFKDRLDLNNLRDLVKLTVLERHLSHALRRSVDLLPAHTLDARMRATTTDAIRVF